VRARRHIRGFTLIEVVIAFAILGLSLSVLYGAFATALARTQRDAQLSEGRLIAQSLIARAGWEFPVAQDSHTGEWNGYSYRLTQQVVNPSVKRNPNTLSPVRVTARVSWGSGGSRQVELSTMKLLPEAPL
jgi:general secretion pathway protein I